MTNEEEFVVAFDPENQRCANEECNGVFIQTQDPKERPVLFDVEYQDEPDKKLVYHYGCVPADLKLMLSQHQTRMSAGLN